MTALQVSDALAAMGVGCLLLAALFVLFVWLDLRAQDRAEAVRDAERADWVRGSTRGAVMQPDVSGTQILPRSRAFRDRSEAMRSRTTESYREELRALRIEGAARPALCPDWCPGGCRREWREARIAELEARLNHA